MFNLVKLSHTCFLHCIKSRACMPGIQVYLLCQVFSFSIIYKGCFKFPYFSHTVNVFTVISLLVFISLFCSMVAYAINVKCTCMIMMLLVQIMSSCHPQYEELLPVLTADEMVISSEYQLNISCPLI